MDYFRPFSDSPRLQEALYDIQERGLLDPENQKSLLTGTVSRRGLESFTNPAEMAALLPVLRAAGADPQYIRAYAEQAGFTPQPVDLEYAKNAQLAGHRYPEQYASSNPQDSGLMLLLNQLVFGHGGN